MVWNIEKMGQYTQSTMNRRKLAVSFFIGELMDELKIDTLCIQELREEGCEMLTQICKHLESKQSNPLWTNDFSPAGIPMGTELLQKAKVARNNSDKTASQLGQISNKEGYAIIFKQNLAYQIKTNIPLSVGGYVSLCCKGLVGELSDENNQRPIVIPNTARNTAITKFPLSNTPSVPLVRSFTATRKRDEKNRKKTRNRDEEKEEDMAVQEDTVRRPARIDLSTITIIFYHAPVGGAGPQFGAGCTTLLDEIQDQSKFPNVIVAGDYNFTGPQHIDSAFNSMLSKGFTAATKDPVSNTYQQTIVNKNGTLGKPRDVLFYRVDPSKITNISSYPKNVVDVVDMLVNTAKHPGFAKAILNNADFTEVVWNSDKATSALKDLFDKKKLPNTFTKNTAAEFYRLFISDHLPLALSFDA